MSTQKQTAQRCRICEGELVYKWTLTVLLERYEADYFECQQCHTLQIPDPFWLEEAYALEEEIAFALNPDEGRFRRNFSAYRYFTALQKAGIFPENPKILDFGGGYGLLTQMLLDSGFDAWHTDAYINKSLFAPQRYIKEIETLPAASFDVILALEVFEHLTAPFEIGKQLQRLLKPNGTLIISTSIYDPSLHTVEWSYLGKEQGQHVTFWTQSALQHYAKFLDFKSINYFPIPPKEFFTLFSADPPHTLAEKVAQATQYLNDPQHFNEITEKWDVANLLAFEKQLLKKVKALNNSTQNQARTEILPTILYDISVLGLGHHNIRAKTGVFRMTERLAEGLLKSPVGNHLVFCATGFPNAFDLTKNYQISNPLFQDKPLYNLKNLPKSDVFHSTFWSPAEQITETQRFLTVHDLIPIKFPHLFTEGDRLAQQETFKKLRLNDWIICVSHSTKRDFCEYTHFDPKRVFVTHLAADPTRFYPCVDPETLKKVRSQYAIPDAPYLLTVATLEPRKNIVHVIKSFTDFVQTQRLSEINLVLVGTKGWKFEEIFAEIAQQTALKKRIIFTGFVADEDLAALYSGALAFVYPSLYEGFGLPPLEAMQCGIPVITSNISSLPEVVGEAGILVNPTDKDALCQHFIEIYYNDSLRKDLSLKSLARAKQFSWEKCVRETITAYQTAFNEGKTNSFIASSTRVEIQPTVVIDGVFYQRFNTGIARVWNSLLTEWVKEGFAERIVVLDRAGTAPRISGIRYRTVLPHDYDSVDFDRRMLQQICDEEGAKVFISTYYTRPLTTPFVFLAHDMIPELIGTNLTHPMWQEKQDSINHAVTYLAVSENTARDLQKFFPTITSDNITVAPNGLDSHFKPASAEEIARFKSTYNIEKPYFLLVGSRGAYKNTLLFFKAFQQLPANQNFAIVCTGSMPFSAEEKPYIQHHTTYNIELDDEALCCAYTGAAALVYPSKYEGFGLPIVEAMACGCPVITCRNSAIPEVAGDAALYVAEDDVTALTQALIAIQQSAVRDPLIAQGFERSQLFSWTKMAKTIKSVLTDVAEKNTSTVPSSPFSFVDEWKKRKNLSLIIKQPSIIQLVRAGHTEEAIKLLKEQIHAEPNHAFAHNDLGVLLFPNVQTQQQAIQHVEQALSLNPIDVSILKNLAKIYHFVGKDTEASNILASLLDNQPDNLEIISEMAEIYTFLKQEERAKRFWEKVRSLENIASIAQQSPPTSGQKEITLSMMQQTTLQAIQTGQAQAVIAKLTEALTIQPDNVLHRNDLGVLLFSNEQTRSQAIENLRIAVAYQPNQVVILRNLARMYALLERSHEAKPLWENLLRLELNDVEAKEALAQFITVKLPTASLAKKKSKKHKKKR